MPRGIPNKKSEVIKNIESEMNGPKTGEVEISKIPPSKVEGSNEFGDEYTMQVIADNEPGADSFRVPNKDPKFEYRFLRDDDDNMSVKTSNLLLQKGGWQVCPTAHLLRIGIDKDLLQPDGSYKVGKMFLAFMPKQLFAKKMAKDKFNRDEAMSGVKRLVEEGDTSRVNIKDVNGIQPGRMDGGRIVFDGKAKGSVKEKMSYGSHNSIDD